MNIHLVCEAPERLTVQLREGVEERTVTVAQGRVGARLLERTIDDAIAHGYGECFWPALEGGHYWWMFRLVGESLDVAVMWSRGGASGWEHVFRAVDAVSHVREQLREELDRIGFDR
jgi:hypothetical protein